MSNNNKNIVLARRNSAVSLPFNLRGGSVEDVVWAALGDSFQFGARIAEEKGCNPLVGGLLAISLVSLALLLLYLIIEKLCVSH